MSCESATVPAAVSPHLMILIFYVHCCLYGKVFKIRDKSEDLPVIVESMLSGIKASLTSNEADLLLALVFIYTYLNTSEMIKECPKCNNEFNCRNDEIFECHCIYVPVSAEAQKYLAENYNDCLCNTCLKEIARAYSTSLEPSKKCCTDVD